MADRNRRRFLALAGLGALGLATGLTRPARAQASVVHVYASPYCGCCHQWVNHMRDAGFEVKVRLTEDLDPVKSYFGVAPALQSCHTAVVDGYVIEGHVPARDVARLLSERPQARGLAVPGMPAGSPGMEQGGASDPYDVLLFGDKGARVYARH